MAPKKQVKIVVPETSKPAKAAPAAKAAAATPAAAKTAQKTAQVAKKATPEEKKAAAPAPTATTSEEKKAAAPATKKGGKKEKKAPVGKKTTEPYTALELANLPEAFQEPQLRKFLSQFGPVVASCYVARTKTGRSRGTGWVVFSSKRNTPSPVFVGTNGMTPSREQLMDAILDECNGMLLGGKTVQARWVVRRTPMPTRAAVDAMRERDWVSKTEGKPLERHEASALKSWVNRLKHGAAAEKKANAYFKEQNIAYEFDGFAKQTTLLTPELAKAANAFIKAVKVGRSEVRKVVRKAANEDKLKTRTQDAAKKAKLSALKKAAKTKAKAKRVTAKKADEKKKAGKRPARGTENKYVTKKAAKSGAAAPAAAKKAAAAVPAKKVTVAKKAVAKK